MRATGLGRYLRVHQRFELHLRISFTSWGNHGITPLWCTCLGVEGREREVQARFPGASLDDEGNPNIPIRLKTGVERGARARSTRWNRCTRLRTSVETPLELRWYGCRSTRARPPAKHTPDGSPGLTVVEAR